MHNSPAIHRMILQDQIAWVMDIIQKGDRGESEQFAFEKVTHVELRQVFKMLLLEVMIVRENSD